MLPLHREHGNSLQAKCSWNPRGRTSIKTNKLLAHPNPGNDTDLVSNFTKELSTLKEKRRRTPYHLCIWASAVFEMPRARFSKKFWPFLLYIPSRFLNILTGLLCLPFILSLNEFKHCILKGTKIIENVRGPPPRGQPDLVTLLGAGFRELSTNLLLLRLELI